MGEQRVREVGPTGKQGYPGRVKKQEQQMWNYIPVWRKLEPSHLLPKSEISCTTQATKEIGGHTVWNLWIGLMSDCLYCFSSGSFLTQATGRPKVTQNHDPFNQTPIERQPDVGQVVNPLPPRWIFLPRGV